MSPRQQAAAVQSVGVRDASPLDSGDAAVIRVASVPASHPYVRHLADPDGADGVVRLADPGDPWWPPAMLDPEWVARHVDLFDLMHVHFGFDTCRPQDLRTVSDLLVAAGKPLIVTVHDLRNPHHESTEPHRSQLEALVERADVVLTLTQWAADRLRDEYGVRAMVIPHPHIVEFDDLRLRQSRPRPTTSVVGLHLKSVRANMELAVLDAAIEAVSRTPGATLQVNVHEVVASPDGRRHDPSLMARLHDAHTHGLIDLQIHEFFDDGRFVDYIESLRVSVLPYRFGTHSGWLEACRDLGVAVVASDCGAYADQGAGFTFVCNETVGFDAASCTQAIESALRSPPPLPVPWQLRLQQRRDIAARHREIYAEATARSSRSAATAPQLRSSK